MNKYLTIVELTQFRKINKANNEVEFVEVKY